MDNIITFFKLLFFLETALLTPAPIDIGNEWVSISTAEPLQAITGGAAIYIDVTKYVKPLDFEGVSKQYPDGTIEGKLVQKDGNIIPLLHSGSSHSNNEVRLIVSGTQSIPTSVDFIEVKLRSKLPLQSVKVYWKNGKH